MNITFEDLGEDVESGETQIHFENRMPLMDELAIPEPKADCDLRPNPTPIAPVVAKATSLPAINSAREEPMVESSSVVDKSVDFHVVAEADAPNLDDESETYNRRAEDKVLPEKRLAENVTEPSNEAKCFAFMGASGGTGVTTLCIQMAFDIAARTQKSRTFGGQLDPHVCLIDLDFETGACASYLDVPPALDVSDICGPASRIDTSIVQALMSQHESGIAVLSTPNALGANSLANPETVLALLDAAAQLYDFVILDLPRIWQPWIGAAIAGADHFAIVSELTIPSLHTARDRIQNIETVMGSDISCEVILNKVERRSFRNSIRLADAEKALKRSVSATICVDQDTTREAINCGEPVGIIRPEARYVKDVRTLSLEWSPPAPTARERRKERRKKKRAA